jgi:hypothetical protein
MPCRALVVLLLAACGCSAKSQPFQPGAAESAGARAGELAISEAPRGAHLVAASTNEPLRLLLLPGGGLVLDTPLFVYEATDDGALSRIGDVASYAALLPDADDDFTGYDVAMPKRRSGLVGPPSRLTWVGFDQSKQWNGKAWMTVPKPTDVPETDVVPWGGFDHPDNMSVHRVKHSPDGRILAFGDIAGSKGTLIIPAGKKTGTVTRIEPEVVEYCDFPNALDGKTYLLCQARWGSNDNPMLFRLGADRWERVAVPDDVKLPPSLAIADDGALWYGDGAEIVRRLANGNVERFVPAEPDASLARPSFFSYASATVAKEGSFEYRNWTETRLRPDQELGHVKEIVSIVPRAGGRAWAVANDAHYKHLVFYVGAKAPEARIAIGSDTDQRNEVRNARGPRTWVGHCPQLFVSTGPRAWSDVETIKKIATGGERAIVEGRLGEKHVTGVLLWRSVPETKESAMEAAANALVTHYTENPVTPPEVSCTVPILDRAQPL